MEPPSRRDVFPAAQPIGDELAAIIDGKVLERMLTGYFPTPRALVAELIAALELTSSPSTSCSSSRGRGAIAATCSQRSCPLSGSTSERDPTHHQALQRAGYRPPQLICGDFLTDDRASRDASSGS